jgi:hypothetical protein
LRTTISIIGAGMKIAIAIRLAACSCFWFPSNTKIADTRMRTAISTISAGMEIVDAMKIVL